MTCNGCTGMPHPPQKKSYLVHLANDKGESHAIIVQTSCIHDMQQWVDSKVFPIDNPKVIYIDAQAAAHVPIVANL
jgi:hypothetical protein